MESKMSKETTGEISRKAVTMTSLEWKICNFSTRFLRKRDHCIKSPLFSFLDAEWRLEIHINAGGSMIGLTDWISFYLFKDHSVTRSHEVGYLVSIRQQDGTDYVYHRLTRHFSQTNGHGSLEDIRCFEKNGAGFGSNMWLPRSDLFESKSEIAPQDTVTIFCILYSNVCQSKRVASQTIMVSEVRSVCTETSEEDLKEAEILSGCEKETLFIPTGMEKLARDFKNLLTAEKDTDLILKVKNKEFRAHKNILRTRSSVFYSMFDHDMAEKNCGTVDIPDCDPEAFQYFLTYLYSASMDNLSDDIVFNLYFIADKYDAEELKHKCVEFMASNLSADSFCNVVALALQYEESALLQTATDFFTKNTKEVIVSVQWQDFLKENPLTANELYLKSFDHNVIRK